LFHTALSYHLCFLACSFNNIQKFNTFCFYLFVWHIVVKADAYPVFAAHVVGSINSDIANFQFIRLFCIALYGTSIKLVDAEEAENPASDIKRQYGLRNPKCLKRHLFAITG